MFPKEIKKITKAIPYTIDDVGRSNDTVYVFEKKYILKVSEDTAMLCREKERFDFLTECGLAGSKSIIYTEENGKGYYLRTYITGESLIHKRFIENPVLLTDTLAQTVSLLRSLDEKRCPFLSSDNEGTDFVHGDLCLPNIYVDENNSFAGFIDLGNSGLGDRWYDYAWMLWSLEYNLGTDKYNEMLLDKIGTVFDKDKFEKYIPEEYRGMHYR